MKAPLIFEIKGNSLDDGAGIRSVVFFKGCPLACIWCHNPEGMRTGVEISFDQSECIGCNTCIETCSQHALARDNPFFIDRQRCTLCFLCTEACPSGALDRVGREMTKEAILEKLLKDKPFYDTSGGGVTLSGGEPTLYMDSVSALLQALKMHGIHCLLETCGQFDLERFTELIYPYLDAIYYDIKLFDPEEHKRFCGVTNATILANFVKLVERTRADGKEFLPRVPLVPNITDSDANLGAIAAFLQSHRVTKAKLLPYNPLWPEKSSKVGIGTDSLDASMKKWMGSEKIKHCETIFREHDLDV